jgi:hypothetical protein
MPRSGNRWTSAAASENAPAVKAIGRTGKSGQKKAGGAPSKGPKKASGRPQEAKIRGNQGKSLGKPRKASFIAIKTERLPDGRTKRILKDKSTGLILEEIE